MRLLASRRARGLAVIGCILSAVLITALLWSSNANSAPGTPQPPVAASAVPSQFGVFKRPQTSADQPDPSLLGRAMRSSTANAQLARLAQTTPSGSRVYLIPTAEGACLASSSFVEQGCTSTAQASNGDSVQSVICAPSLPASDVEIYGVLPDSASSVTVTHADGSTSSVPVQGNTFVYRTPKAASPARSLSWSGHNIPANLPSDINQVQCDTSVSPQAAQAASRQANGRAARARAAAHRTR